MCKQAHAFIIIVTVTRVVIQVVPPFKYIYFLVTLSDSIFIVCDLKPWFICQWFKNIGLILMQPVAVTYLYM